jgi:hypothetical protein
MRTGKEASMQWMLTKDFAAFLRAGSKFTRQRKISLGRVGHLADAMEDDLFMNTSQVFVCYVPKGDFYLVNGNHTCEAVKQTNKPQLVTLTFVPVANEDEAGKYYAHIDVQKVRTTADKMRGMGVETDSWTRAVHSACRLIQGGFSYKPASFDAVLKTQTEYQTASEDLEQAISSPPGVNDGTSGIRNRLKIAPYLAVALITMKDNPKASAAFWAEIVLNQGGAPDTQARRLHDYMMQTRISGAYGTKEAWGKAMSAWNNYYSKRNPSRIVAENEIKILGTKWAKGAP